MEKVSKLTAIKRAFLEESSIDPKILEERREICGSCEYNSANIDNSKLSNIEVARKKLLKDFCTACACNIEEKTTQETEECGLTSLMKLPKWNRVKLETINRYDLDIINLSPDLVNVDVHKNSNNYLVYFSNIKRGDKQTANIHLKSKQGVKFDITSMSVSCGSCTKYNYKRVDSNTYELNITIDTSSMNGLNFSKGISFSFQLNHKYGKSIIKLEGNFKK